MKKNVGSVDKVIRLLLAAVFIILFVAKVVTGVLGIILLVLAGILVVTSIINFCPLWAVFGVNTCPAKK